MMRALLVCAAMLAWPVCSAAQDLEAATDSLFKKSRMVAFGDAGVAFRKDEEAILEVSGGVRYRLTGPLWLQLEYVRRGEDWIRLVLHLEHALF